jgi:uncharacterized membrane protein YGL010W
MDPFTVIFIGTVIIAITEIVKRLWPDTITGALTIIVALLVGALSAVFSDWLDLAHLGVAQGVIIALASVGVHTTAAPSNAKQ